MDDVRSILNDYSQTTPQAMQTLARQYLARDRSWRLQVIPQTLAQAKGIPVTGAR